MKLYELFEINTIELTKHSEDRFHFSFELDNITYQAAFQKDRTRPSQSIWFFAFWADRMYQGRSIRDTSINSLAGRKAFTVFSKIVSGIYSFIIKVKPKQIQINADGNHIGIYDSLAQNLAPKLRKINYEIIGDIADEHFGRFYIQPIESPDESEFDN